ncbi:cytochrome c biogenesis CcdA family protein [Blastococcus sp. Marseille-P5729]|uniref:cytochrome c biogenesis CcdA family protein n=1 Tax=Blastococcus sp. Marseille-P5729 TaxID=2086582 RepID=UPI000D0F590A|nr:cytochrome c biogenesis protein CcdA [Blastococcus sp. Marseille-P5729]
MTTLASSIEGTVTSGSLLLASLLAIAAGLVSFASPCVLPLVPGYLSYVTSVAGESATEVAARDSPARRRVILGAALFVAGFAAVFVSYGALFGQAGSVLRQYEEPITQVMGVLIILMGIAFLGKLPWMQREWRFHKLPAAGLVGAPLLGAFFAIGWIPCIGPTLTAILTLSYQEGSAGRGAFLTALYSLGLGLPFILIAAGFGWAMKASGFARRHAGALMKIGGIMLILLGIILLTGWWTGIVATIQGWFPTENLLL